MFGYPPGAGAAVGPTSEQLAAYSAQASYPVPAGTGYGSETYQQPFAAGQPAAGGFPPAGYVGFAQHGPANRFAAVRLRGLPFGVHEADVNMFLVPTAFPSFATRQPTPAACVQGLDTTDILMVNRF